MTHTIGRARCLALIAMAVALAVSGTRSYGGGARNVDGIGNPMGWSTATAVVYNRDPGSLGTLINPLADNLLADAFSRWQSAPLTAITFTAGQDLLVDVNKSNWNTFWGNEQDSW